jgi:hypothetical protein
MNGLAPEATEGEEAPPLPEGHPEFVKGLKEYYASFRQFLTTHKEEMSTALAAAQEELDALPEEDPPADPAPAEEEGADETMREPPEISPEELERRAKKEELQNRIAKLQKDIEICEASSVKLEEPLELGQDFVKPDKEEFIAKEMEAILRAFEKTATVVNEQAKQEDAKRCEEEAKKKGNKRGSKFKPPPREDDLAASGIDPGATTSSAGDAGEPAFEAPVYLIPMKLDTFSSEGEGGEPFQTSKEIAQEGIALPIIPDEPPLPPAAFCQLVQRPQTRPPRVPPENFCILTPVPPEAVEGEENAEGEGSAAGDATATERTLLRTLGLLLWLMLLKGLLKVTKKLKRRCHKTAGSSSPMSNNASSVSSSQRL